MFKIKCSDIPDYITGTENNSLAELAMPGVASGISYEGIGAQNFLGPAGAEYQPFLALSDTDNYPWLVPIPHYSAKINNKDYKLVYRSCCDYINPTSRSKTFTPTSGTKEWYNDGNNNWSDETGGQNLFAEPTSHIMVALQAGGGGGAGSSGVHNGTGGGGGAAAVLIINIGKLKKIRFNAGLGGAAGQKSIDLNTDRHGSAGTDSTIVMTLPNGNTITARVGGGKGGLAYSSNAGAGREGGDGGAAVVTVESSTQIFSTAAVSDSDLASVNYVGISTTGAKLSYPDTKSEALFYVLKVVGGGKGAADSALLSDAVTSPIISTSINVPFAPGVSHTIPALSKRSHTYANYITAGYDGGDGGYSLYGQGGLCSISYLPDVNGAIPLWTNAQPPTGYGAGGSGDVFLVLVGKDGTKGGDGIIYILSANETIAPSQLTEILPYQSGILSPNAVQCLHLKVDDAIYDPENYSMPSFVACSYEYGSDGKTLMPALYATGINPVDWDNPYIYIGKKTILGTTYDTWQKIEANGIYNWTSSAKKIAYTNIIVNSNKFIKDLCNREGLHTTNTATGIVVAPTCVKQGYTYSNCTECGYRFKGNYVPALGHSLGDWEVTIPPTLTSAGKQVKKCTRCNNIIESEIIPAIEPDIGTYEWLASGAVVQKYYVRTDSGAGITEGAYEDITFVACGYLRNNDNIVTPVLYGTDLSVSSEPCLEDAFFYVGQEVLYGVTYDKWRKIELGGGNTYNWTSSSAYYVYTNVIVKNNRFIGSIYASSIAGTVSISWGVRAAQLFGQGTTYTFSASPQTVSAPDGYIIQDFTLTRTSMSTTSGSKMLADPQGTISLNGKTLTITLVSQIPPLGTGKGVATIDYVCKCAPENDIIDTTSVSIPYTTASSPTNGYQYTITSQSAATITAPSGYIIVDVETTDISSSSDSHGTGNVTTSVSIASDKKTATVYLDGYIQGAAGSSALMTVTCNVTYRSTV